MGIRCRWRLWGCSTCISFVAFAERSGFRACFFEFIDSGEVKCQWVDSCPCFVRHCLSSDWAGEGGWNMVEMTTVLKRIDEEAGVAWLTFNRPEKKNAMSQKFMAELIAALKELADNDKIKCIVTTGSGDSYSSGLDLYDLRDDWKRKRTWDQRGTTYEIVRLLRNIPQVTVAAVRGWCLGGGLALINGHDLCIAAESSKFGMPAVVCGSYGAAG